jgi:galactokinase/mevalonate kinase-like predicted kinase
MPAYYQKGEVGAVTSAAIGAHIYVTVGKHWDSERIRLSYSVTEDIEDLSDLHHELVKEAIEYTGSGMGIEISSIAQIPGKGVVTVGRIDVPKHLLRQMDRAFPLYYTNLTRRSKRLLSQTAKHLSKKRLRAEAKATVGLASQAREALVDGRLPDLGEIMHEGWERKCRINENATTEEIDEFYEKAIKAGAIGGKLCGAGGGGFFVFYVPEEKLEKVDKALGLRRIHVNYGVPGSQIVYRDHASF